MCISRRGRVVAFVAATALSAAPAASAQPGQGTYAVARAEHEVTGTCHWTTTGPPSSQQVLFTVAGYAASTGTEAAVSTRVRCLVYELFSGDVVADQASDMTGGAAVATGTTVTRMAFYVTCWTGAVRYADGHDHGVTACR